ncbi:MAG: hypothetical protein ACKOVB_10520 [Terrabacter sp.]
MWHKKVSIALSAGSLAALSALAFAVPTEAARQGAQRIRINDDCNPASFNAVLGSPDACVKKNGKTTFEAFVAELTATQKVAAWNFKPSMLKIKEGRPVILDNRGGETHTFTMVDHFGGGFVGFLNAPSGNPVPAEECVTHGAGGLLPKPPSPVNVFVSAGAREAFDTAHLMPGTYLFQCCIHPWMRVVLTVK